MFSSQSSQLTFSETYSATYRYKMAQPSLVTLTPMVIRDYHNYVCYACALAEGAITR